MTAIQIPRVGKSNILTPETDIIAYERARQMLKASIGIGKLVVPA